MMTPGHLCMLPARSLTPFRCGHPSQAPKWPGCSRQAAPKPAHTALCVHKDYATAGVGGSVNEMLAAAGLPAPPALNVSPMAAFNPVTLAYLGDSIWELMLRQQVFHSTPASEAGPSLQALGAKKANARQQAIYHDLLLATARATEAVPETSIAASSNANSKPAVKRKPQSGGGFGKPSKSAPQTNKVHTTMKTAPMTSSSQANTSTHHPDTRSPADSNAASINNLLERYTPQPATQNSTSQPEQVATLHSTTTGTSSIHTSRTQPSPCQLPAASDDVHHQPHSFILTPEEVQVLRWARNSASLTPPSNTDSLAYRKATALEALVAYLYLTHPGRCVDMIRMLLYVPLTPEPIQPGASNS